jgi:hypothetical protein
MNVTKTKWPITMLKFSKNENLGNFEPLIAHGPYWIHFIIHTFISKKKRYSKCLYNIWNKIISFDMKKKGNLR